MSMGLAIVLLLTLLVAGFPDAARATGFKVTVKSGGPVQSVPQGHLHHVPRPQGHIHHVQSPSLFLQQRHLHKGVVHQPVFVVTSPRCVVPGYWAYTWVPQSYVSHAWVPGHYNSDALWVEGHYEPRAYAWGYYQPYWVPESVTYC